MQHTDQLNELAAALAKAQGEIVGAKKDSENPHFRSKYADLSACWEACRGPLTKHGLSIVQSPRLVSAGDAMWLVELETKLLHASGQWMADTVAVPLARVDAQGLGSCCTYLRRYALSAFLSIAPEDDDGNAAVGASPERGVNSAPARETRPPGAMDTVILHVLGVVEGVTKNGKKKFTISGDDRRFYATFSDTDAAEAKEAQVAGHVIEVTFKETQWGRAVQALRRHVEPPL